MTTSTKKEGQNYSTPQKQSAWKRPVNNKTSGKFCWYYADASHVSQRCAACVPGIAALSGERAKMSRYGELCTPVSFETYGRLGHQSVNALRSITCWLAGRSSGHQLYCAWRLAFERSLVQEIAETALQCLGHRCRIFLSIHL